MPWGIPYLLPVEKWLPLVWPNDYWEVRSFPLFDELGNMAAPQIPEGLAVPWWKTPKDTWPYQTPFEPKVFGAWPASKIAMPEDLVNHPPFGFIKLKTAWAQNQTSGNQIAFTRMKIHTRRLSSAQMKVRTLLTPMGPRFYYMGDAWEQHDGEYREQRAAMNQKWRKAVAEHPLSGG